MSSEPSRHIFLCCGEASGDRYGAALLSALKEQDPALRISALGGPLMASAGAEIIAPSAEVAVMGFSEVLGSLAAIWKVRQTVWKHLADQGVDLVVPIDFPGFNGRLAGRARALGLPVFWLIAPQVWAWGSWRTRGFRRKVDRLGTILPFETEYFQSHGFEVFPMGHPLMEDYGEDYPLARAMSLRERNLNDRERPLTIAILPGSRRQELNHLLPVLKVTAQAITGHLAAREVRFLVSAAPGVDPDSIRSVFTPQAEVSREPLPRLLENADLALVCSGTASLEAALAGVPHELVYRTGALNYFLAKRLVRSSYIGLSNLILDKQVVREHIQNQAGPLPLARSLLRWITRPAERQVFYGDAARIRKVCGRSGVWRRTASALLEFAEGTEAEPRSRSES